MYNGLKIYACSGLAGSEESAQPVYTYWTDNTSTVRNTCAVNNLLAEINLLAAKINVEQLIQEDLLTALNLIDLYVVCLNVARDYSGRELVTCGYIIGAMADEGLFYCNSTDDNERDENLDSLINTVYNRLSIGEYSEVDNATTRWFDNNVLALDYVGLSPDEQDRISEILSAGISGSDSVDAGTKLNEFGGYFLYLYMSKQNAMKAGKVVYSKWKKEQEMYKYVHQKYDIIYGSKEAVDKVIWTGICNRYNHTPEYMLNQIKQGAGQKQIGDPVTIISAIAAAIAALVSLVQIIMAICKPVLEAKYAAPEDPEWGTPGDEEDLQELESWSKESSGDNTGKYGIIGAAALLVVSLFK